MPEAADNATAQSPATPTTPTADAGANAADTTAETRQVDTSAQDAAAEDAWLSKNDVPGASPITPADPKQTTAADEADETGDQAGATEPGEQPGQAAPVATLSGEDKTLLSRWKMDESDLEGMNPAARQKLLRSLEQRTNFVDQLARNSKQPQQDQQQTQQQDTTPADAGLDSLWKPTQDYWGEAATTPLRSAVEKTVAHSTRGLNEMQTRMALRMERDDIDRAFDELQLPEGVDKADPKVREQILQRANAELQGTFDWIENNWRHAIPKAAALLFTKQIHDAETKRRQQQQKSNLRGSAHANNRVTTTKRALTEDEREDLALKLLGEGKSREEIERELAMIA